MKMKYFGLSGSLVKACQSEISQKYDFPKMDGIKNSDVQYYTNPSFINSIPKTSFEVVSASTIRTFDIHSAVDVGTRCWQ